MLVESPGTTSPGLKGKTGPTVSWARTPAAQAAALPTLRAHGDDPQPGCTHPQLSPEAPAFQIPRDLAPRPPCTTQPPHLPRPLSMPSVMSVGHPLSPHHTSPDKTPTLVKPKPSTLPLTKRLLFPEQSAQLSAGFALDS